MDFEKYAEHLQKSVLKDRLDFIGVVEDNLDPLQLGRVKARAFHIHPEDRTLVPTEDLPWAIVLQPTTSASISGIGWSPNGLELGSWVHGYFADGEDAQYPIIDGVFPVIHRPNQPGQPGGTSAGYLDQSADYYEGTRSGAESPPYHGQPVENIPGGDSFSGFASNPPNGTNHGTGALAAHGDINMMLEPKDASRWDSLGLPTYNWHAAPQGYACKDGKESLRFHYGTALAFEKLTKEHGQKLSITSAYRTPAYNSRLSGAAKNSYHIHGRALDISKGSIGAVIPFCALAAKNGFVGFGIYPSFVHIDTGTGRVFRGSSSELIKALKAAGWYEGKPGLEGIATTQGAAAEEDGDQSGLPDASNLNSTGEVRDYVDQRLEAEGFSDVQRAAILANAQHESAFNPNAVGDGGDAYGIFQWNDRQAALRSYTGIQSGAIPVDRQMDFFVHELNGSESRAGGALRGATTLSQANGAMAQYERYQGYKSAGGERSARLATASSIFNGANPGSDAPLKGFVDPTNSLPFASYRGEPSTHVNARGINTYQNQNSMANADHGRASGYPVAGDFGTIGEPESTAAPQYPWNKTYGTKSGHLLEFDDTPGSERVNIKHKSGTSIEIFANGAMAIRTTGDAYKIDRKDSYHMVDGKYYLTSVNDMHLRTTGDMIQQADGSISNIIGNDHSLIASGDITIGAGGDIKIKGTQLVIEAENIDFLASGNMNLEARGAMTIKGDSIETESKGQTGIKSGGTIAADPGEAVRVAEGKAKGTKGANSADIGPIPARKIVSKSRGLPAGTTSGQAMGNYSGGRSVE